MNRPKRLSDSATPWLMRRSLPTASQHLSYTYSSSFVHRPLTDWLTDWLAWEHEWTSKYVCDGIQFGSGPPQEKRRVEGVAERWQEPFVRQCPPVCIFVCVVCSGRWIGLYSCPSSVASIRETEKGIIYESERWPTSRRRDNESVIVLTSEARGMEWNGDREYKPYQSIIIRASKQTHTTTTTQPVVDNGI